jgi:hypothetical protein
MGKEEGEQCRSKRHCFGFFFFFKEKKCNLEEEKKFGSDPKMGYDTRLPEDAHYLSQTHSSI